MRLVFATHSGCAGRIERKHRVRISSIVCGDDDDDDDFSRTSSASPTVGVEGCYICPRKDTLALGRIPLDE